MKIARMFCLAAVLGLTLSGTASSADPLTSAMNLYQQLGGAETVNKLAGSLLTVAKKDSRLASVLGKVQSATAAPKLSNQLCSTLGGGCAAPFTDAQIASASEKLTSTQKTAVAETLKSSLKTVTSNPLVRDAITKALGPQLGGILALLG